MDTLAIQSSEVIDSSTIKVQFSHELNPSIGKSNVSIEPDGNVPVPSILGVVVLGNTMTITTNPLTPLNVYVISFISTSLVTFNSKNGTAIMPKDNVSNKISIIGKPDPANPVLDYFKNFYRDSVYDLDDDNTIVSKTMQAFSTIFAKALYDIRQVKNENYISFNVKDERKVRGAGPYDRLDEEGAYEILRVGTAPTSSVAENAIKYANFPSSPISLKKILNTDSLFIDSANTAGSFNINELMLNLTKSPVIKLIEVVFTQSGSPSQYKYDIEKYGYRILDSKYDPDYGFDYNTLNNKQIMLNSEILSDSNFLLNNIVAVNVTYEYKNEGRIVDDTTVVVSTVSKSIREVIPSIINVFDLKHAPVVSSNGTIPTTGGCQFINPNTLASQSHPAFLYEIPFSLSYLPSRAGEYSIDYSIGKVYVFGSSSNDGTGAYPPLVTYNYLNTYVDNIDYVYDEGFYDLVALPNGNLIDNAGTIAFNYEEALVPEIDYKSNPHIEILNERIGNNIVALNAIKASKSPITNVFRIFNETTGEIYKVSRWNNDKIYFTYNTAPKLLSTTRERVSFTDQINELLFINSILTNTFSIKVFKVLLDNNNIVSSSEDSLGSSLSSSATFSNPNIFKTEKWFDKSLSQTSNIDRLTEVGEYMVDYEYGIVYCAVSNFQGNDIGSVSYKTNNIQPISPHVVTVDDIYYQITQFGSKNKNFTYSSFKDNSIGIVGLDYSDETYKYNNLSSPYQIYNGYVGVFADTGFLSGLTYPIKSINGVFELNDLQNNKTPFNFGNNSSFSGYDVGVNSFTDTKYDTIDYDGYDYYVTIPQSFSYFSPNITITVSVIRQSDSAELWDNLGVIVPGTELKLLLSGVNSPTIGDTVIISYTISVNNLSRMVVNYNRGDLFVDYSYLADEIVISYEYGDNLIDFRESGALDEGQEYYVSYKVGALRDALLKNFGTLVNIPELATFDIDLDRERYRDALSAALESFLEGPTISAIDNIVQKISHTPPEITESIFQNWSLGNSLLNPRSIDAQGEFALIPAKHGDGVLVNNENQSITFPTTSNLKLESGTLESWVIPHWDGIDNGANLTFNVKKNLANILPSEVFIGAEERHPTSANFSLNKSDLIHGKPNMNKDGVYIYYDKDISSNFNRWYVNAVDGYTDGYISLAYTVDITSNGNFYDSKAINDSTNMTFRTGLNSLSVNIAGTPVDKGFTFISDVEHYVFDTGEDVNKNRFSIFKDVSGYLVFRVYDKFKNVYSVSADVSSWKENEKHHVAASWKINTKENRDELHLFVDGTETPNIIKYGSRIAPYLHEKFRTINPEEIIGLFDRDTLSSIDLTTVSGSNQVVSQSGINFSVYDISIGDIIHINESGFSTLGYTITYINGNTLTLASPMPLNITNGKYTINRVDFNVSTEADIYPNIAVYRSPSVYDGYDLSITSGSNIVTSLGSDFIAEAIQPGYSIHIYENGLEILYTILSVSTNSLTINDNLPISNTGLNFNIYSGEEIEIPGLRATRPSYSLAKDGYYNNIITFNNNVFKKDLLLLKTLGLNNRRIKKKYYVWGDNQESVLQTRLPAPVALDEVKIYRIFLPTTAIGPANSIIINNTFNFDDSETKFSTNAHFGRTVQVEISGTNTDFSAPVQVLITGQVSIYTITETVSFTDYGKKNSTNKFIKIFNIQVICTPLNITKDCLNVELRETYSMTRAEGSELVPVIRYSYQMGSGTTLQNDGYDGYDVKDNNAFFSKSVIDNFLLIHSPISVAGYYKITNVSDDFKRLSITPTVGITPPFSTFTGATYSILNISDYRSGLQNGFFMLQQNILVADPYFLEKGWYEFDYYSYLISKVDLPTSDSHIGSDFRGKKPFNGILNELKISSRALTDTRIGEVVLPGESSITKDYNSLKAIKKDINTLMLTSFNSFPFVNDADFYTRYEDKSFFQLSESVNDQFAKGVFLTEKPLVIPNDGILDVRKEGTIEFWVRPIFDTGNDPNERYYFDAFGAISEEVTSDNYATINVSGNIGSILSIKTLQNDFNYADGAKINNKTILLNRRLPNHNTKVVVNYIPSGLQGDRISIFKDKFGYLNFNVNASGNSYAIKSPIYWSKNTWHRVKASYKFNTIDEKDQLKLFVDGYERGNVLYGSGPVYGPPLQYGLSYVGNTSFIAPIKFKDPINQMVVGAQFDGSNKAFVSMDNLRISNIFRPVYAPFGESIDINYSSNLKVVFPVTSDLYTTYLMDFESSLVKNNDFVVLVNKNSGIFDFSVNIFDSFGIIGSSAKVQEILEKLIKTLKPANSRVSITYSK